MPRPTFPKGLREFRQKFSSDANCWEYLSQSRWPEGFRCPKCDSSRSWWILSRHAHECQQCGHQTSVSAGTQSVQLMFATVYVRRLGNDEKWLAGATNAVRKHHRDRNAAQKSRRLRAGSGVDKARPFGALSPSCGAHQLMNQVCPFRPKSACRL
jgi:Zn ribbon nucleic-acid-binding protein